MSRIRVRAKYEPLLSFERERSIRPKETGWSNQRMTCYLGRNGATILSCWQKRLNHGRIRQEISKPRDNTAISRSFRFDIIVDTHITRTPVTQRPLMDDSENRV